MWVVGPESTVPAPIGRGHRSRARESLSLEGVSCLRGQSDDLPTRVRDRTGSADAGNPAIRGDSAVFTALSDRAQFRVRAASSRGYASQHFRPQAESPASGIRVIPIDRHQLRRQDALVAPGSSDQRLVQRTKSLAQPPRSFRTWVRLLQRVSRAWRSPSSDGPRRSEHLVEGNRLESPLVDDPQDLSEERFDRRVVGVADHDGARFEVLDGQTEQLSGRDWG